MQRYSIANSQVNTVKTGCCIQGNAYTPVWKQVLERINGEKQKKEESQPKAKSPYEILKIKKTFDFDDLSFSSSDSDLDESNNLSTTIEQSKEYSDTKDTSKSIDQTMDTKSSSFTFTSETLVPGSPDTFKSSVRTIKTEDSSIFTDKDDQSTTFESISTNFSKVTGATSSKRTSKTSDITFSIKSSPAKSYDDSYSSTSSYSDI